MDKREERRENMEIACLQVFHFSLLLAIFSLLIPAIFSLLE
jgi:uncharacterized membrane protein